MADIDKAIVSNSQALKTKYRTNGFNAIKAAVDKLIAADAQRHIKSKLIFIDDAAMTKLGGTLPVSRCRLRRSQYPRRRSAGGTAINGWAVRRLSHFINYHGSSQRPEFYGQKGGDDEHTGGEERCSGHRRRRRMLLRRGTLRSLAAGSPPPVSPP